MKNIITYISIVVCLVATKSAQSQINEEQVGAWYMYFFDSKLKKSNWGLQGDIQYRNWNIAGDLEQLLLRGGLTYRPKNTALKFTLGYANITSGTPGDSKVTTTESRIYQEAVFSAKFGKRFYTNHRFRYEQRFVEGHDFRTRYRYNLFLNIALNKPELEKNTLYLALYNEIFINGQKHIGDGNTVEVFDRNRFYAGLGYHITDPIKVQVGFMNQNTNNWRKNQLQFSLHHKI